MRMPLRPYRLRLDLELDHNHNLHLLLDNPLLKTSWIHVFVMANHNVSIWSGTCEILYVYTGRTNIRCFSADTQIVVLPDVLDPSFRY